MTEGKSLKIIERQEKIIQDFSVFSDWESKYKKIIELGKKMQALPDDQKSEDLKVRGCQSQVWLKAELDPEGRIRFQGDSDALIVKGLLALVLKVFSEASPAEILEAPIDFLKKLGLDSHLSPSRSNGVYAMIKQIKFYAQAFLLLQRSKS